MSEPTPNPTGEESKPICPRVPQSIMIASRDELDVNLEIDGDLPEDLKGHVFIVAPVGTVTSGGLPFKDGGTYLNGDGMIYRLDFDRQGEVRLKTRLVKPEDYIFDEKTHNIPGLLLKFQNHGLVRFSYLLGSRNELNTAFLAIKFPGEANERLLVTYDAGIPYEIDTETLELVTSIGNEKTEWQSEIDLSKFPFHFKFSPILTTAHPAFDTYTNQMFTVNYGRSLDNFIESLISKLRTKEESKFRQVEQLLEKFLGITRDFVYLIRWDGLGSLERWKLVNPDGSPVSIKQSMHQIGVAKDYVVLMDTAFTVGIAQVINNPFPADKEIERILRELVENPLSPDSIFYIVRRDDLKQGQRPAEGQPEVEVVAQKVIIPREAAHFLVDYENPDNKITLHVAHICAWNVSEWLREYDSSPYPDSSVPSRLYGIQQGEMDISRMGRYVIDANTLGNNPKIESKVIFDPTCTWGPGLFTYRDRLPSGMTPAQLDNIYWISFGLWKELMTEFMYELYKDYPYQEVPRQKVLELAAEGKPACLFRLHASSNESMAIADSYQCPDGHMILSPQFVPRGDGQSSTNGYIVCIAFTPERSEIWIFEAWDLKKGPLCKLHHPQLNIGFSLHAAWLPNISSAKSISKTESMRHYLDLVKDLV